GAGPVVHRPDRDGDRTDAPAGATSGAGVHDLSRDDPRRLPARRARRGPIRRPRLRAREGSFRRFFSRARRPGTPNPHHPAHPQLVGGMDRESTRLAAAVYRKGLEHIVEVSSAEVAESAKLLENIFRSVNIAMINEMKMVLTAMGIDIWEVIAAASTKPFGFM